MEDSSPDLSLRLRRNSSDSRDSFYLDFAQGIDSDIDEMASTSRTAAAAAAAAAAGTPVAPPPPEEPHKSPLAPEPLSSPSRVAVVGLPGPLGVMIGAPGVPEEIEVHEMEEEDDDDDDDHTITPTAREGTPW